MTNTHALVATFISFFVASLALVNGNAVAATGAQEPDLAESACAIHIEGDYDIKKRLDEIGCKRGDSVLLYNHSAQGKWEIVLPVRIAAILICEMDKPISAIGNVGSQPYQSVICTYSGKVRKFKSTDKNLQGWGQIF